MEYSNELIQIMDASKTHDGAGSSYIAYAIRYADKELKRRYSEFHSLRKLLKKIHPTIVVPPIPEKHSISDYAVKQNRAKQDPQIIEKRKRMLQSFLNRVAWHPVLSTEYVFHRFLEPGILWSDIAHSARVTAIPKVKSTASIASSITSTIAPSASTVKNPDPVFTEAENFTIKFENHIKDVLEKTHKKVVKRYAELSTDYAELGATYNAFSLNENVKLANGTEKLGQAVDTMHIATNRLVQQMEEKFSEPLHEYGQFCDVIKSVLKYVKQQQIEYETTSETLDAKRAYLANLEKVEQEAQRLEEALKKEGYNSPKASRVASANRTTASRGIVGTISEKINNLIDSDPETTRKHNIAKTKDIIAQLEQSKEKQAKEITRITAAVQQDLDRFQQQKIRDLRRMIIDYAKIQSEYCRRNLAAWEEAKAEVNKIPA
ncbi:hypothetical protein BKA69DRAFT_1026216 [Paraphysoderma sedebokerense]|nr:hypothetical protein BKA69DRAFT_1026216 [Paraphysoderma sedebokerense]